LEEVKILAGNTYALYYFLTHGCNPWHEEFSLSGLMGNINTPPELSDLFDEYYLVPCRGLQDYQDWLEIGSGIFNEDKAETVFSYADSNYWVTKEGKVYVKLSVPQHVHIKFDPANCRILTTENGKATAEISLKYHHDPLGIDVDDIKLIAEFEKTEKGWRMSGGEYFDYLFAGKSNTNPETHDPYCMLLVLTALMILTVVRKRNIVL
jgi:hypothetical protein